MGQHDRSEYDGGGVMPNTVHPKGDDALNAHDKLRLQSLTGQEESAHAPIDPYHWYGGVAPDPEPHQVRDEVKFRDPGRYREYRR